MKRFLIALIVIACPVSAQDGPSPEECRLAGDSSISVEYGGKTYRLASEACRVQFLSDPERYAQLYDALAELEQSGKKVAAPRDASLVPS